MMTFQQFRDQGGCVAAVIGAIALFIFCVGFAAGRL